MTTLDKIIREGKSFGNCVLIVMCLVGLGIALGLLAGCAPAHLSDSGRSTEPPGGFVRLCQDHPTFPGCTK